MSKINKSIIKVVPGVLFTFALASSAFATPVSPSTSVSVWNGNVKVTANCVKVKVINGRVIVDTSACHNINTII